MKRIFMIVFAFAFVAIAKDGDLHEMKNSSGTDWDFYGSARMSGFYWDRSLWYMNNAPIYDPSGNQIGTKYEEDPIGVKRWIWDLEYMSRFGALARKGDFGFRFEAGWSPTIRNIDISPISGSSQGEATATNKFVAGLVLRRLYGEWYINDYMSLLVGQEWSIANFFPSAQVFDMEDGLCYCGALFTGREPQVKLSFEYDSLSWQACKLSSKLELAAIKPDTFIFVVDNQPPQYVNAEENIPKLETGLTENVSFIKGLIGTRGQFVLGTNRYNMLTNEGSADTSGASKAKRFLVKSNCEGMDIDLTLWKFRFSFAGAQGTNLSCFGVAMGDPWGSRTDNLIQVFYPSWGHTLSDTTQKICDVYTKEWCWVANVRPFDFLALEAGLGKIKNVSDNYLITSQPYGTNMMNRMAWYVNMQFYLLNGHVTFIPEYSFSDLGGGQKGTIASGSEGAGKWKAYGFLLQLDM